MLSCVLLKLLIQEKMKEGDCGSSNSTKVEGEPAKRQESTKPMRVNLCPPNICCHPAKTTSWLSGRGYSIST